MEPTQSYPYRPQILDALVAHGVRPSEPELVLDYLDDLYRYEIRRLRDRMFGNELPRSEYATRVARLRDRYWLLSFPARRWTVGPG